MGKIAIFLRIKKSRIFWHENFKIEYFWCQNLKINNFLAPKFKNQAIFWRERACSYIAVHIDICAEWPFFEISSWNFACGTVAPPYTLCMSLSQIGEKKTTIFSSLLIALKFGIYDFLTKYMKKQISKYHVLFPPKSIF